MAMLPGIAKIKNQIAERNLDEKILKRQIAIIDSMTPQERRNPDVLKASRKRRIAAGSGTKPEDINRLIKMHRGMADMMKAMGSAKRGPMAGLANAFGMGGGMPSAADMAKLAENMPGGLPPECRPGIRPEAERFAARNAGIAAEFLRHARRSAGARQTQGAGPARTRRVSGVRQKEMTTGDP